MTDGIARDPDEVRPDAGPAHAGENAASPRRRLGTALHPRGTRTQLMVGLLCALLGFGLVAQVHATNGSSFLQTARTSDLVGLLDNLNQREQRLDAERQDLQVTRDQLVSGADKGATALQEAQAQAHALGVLAGTVTDDGPGVVVTVADPRSSVTAAVLLDTIEELRDAGAEAIQVGPVRVVASSSFLDGPSDGEISLDGVALTRPFVVRAVGDPDTLAAALDIPGGVVDTVDQAGGTAVVAKSQDVKVDALRAVPTPRYARPVPTS